MSDTKREATAIQKTWVTGGTCQRKSRETALLSLVSFALYVVTGLYTEVKQLQALSLWPLLPSKYVNKWEQTPSCNKNSQMVSGNLLINTAVSKWTRQFLSLLTE